MNSKLDRLLDDNFEAKGYFDSLHLSIKHRVLENAEKITTVEDLYAVANNAMSNEIKNYNLIDEDSKTYPDLE